MKLLLNVLVCLLALCLTSCVHRSTAAESQCQRACVVQFEQCKKQCTDNCTNCSISELNMARLNYKHYINEELVQGDFIARDLQSYRSPLQCRKVSCNCLADLNVCNQACTGIIKKQLRILPTC